VLGAACVARVCGHALGGPGHVFDFGIECCHGRLASPPCMCVVPFTATLSLDKIDFVTEGRTPCTVHVCNAMDLSA